MRKAAIMYFSLYLIFGFVTGCASLHEQYRNLFLSQSKVDDAPLKEGEGIVFGSIVIRNYDSASVLLSPDKNLPLPDFLIAKAEHAGTFIARATPSLVTIKKIFVDNDYPYMHFALRLPVGEYSFFRLNSINVYSLTNIPFTVESGKVTYIGSLQADIKYVSSLGVTQVSDTYTKVNDHEEADTESFKANNPNVGYVINKNLMTKR